jgi:hypothetical protein
MLIGVLQTAAFSLSATSPREKAKPNDMAGNAKPIVPRNVPEIVSPNDRSRVRSLPTALTRT